MLPLRNSTHATFEKDQAFSIRKSRHGQCYGQSAQKEKQKNERCNKEESNRNRMRLLKMKRATIRKKKMFGRHTQGRQLSSTIDPAAGGVLYGAV